MSTAPTPTRKSKIARLPRLVREQLNRRLDDGEAPASLAKWLNAEPDVEEILAAEFAGREITEQNLSDWRQAGFQDWLKRQDQLASAQSLIEQTDDLLDASGGADLLDRISDLAALSLGKLLQKLNASEDANPAAVLSVIRDIARLRKADTEARKARLQQSQWEAEQTRESAKAREAEEQKLRQMPAEALRDLLSENSLLRDLDIRFPQIANEVRRIFQQVRQDCNAQLSSLKKAA